MIDFSQLGMSSNQKNINPRDIFMRLSQKTAKYQCPRDVQGEVWKQWYEQRNNKDTIIKTVIFGVEDIMPIQWGRMQRKYKSIFRIN